MDSFIDSEFFKIFTVIATMGTGILIIYQVFHLMRDNTAKMVAFLKRLLPNKKQIESSRQEEYIISDQIDSYSRYYIKLYITENIDKRKRCKKHISVFSVIFIISLTIYSLLSLFLYHFNPLNIFFLLRSIFFNDISHSILLIFSVELLAMSMLFVWVIFKDWFSENSYEKGYADRIEKKLENLRYHQKHKESFYKELMNELRKVRKRNYISYFF
ncbi:hypothetical protein QJU23_07235 [Pasteurella atlantica]|uniref:Uncharacterized protein n=2 Tax=Pasteurellaceae TaxID=712 RepID=A0ACC6HMW4_9PAST|nr:hypothetical protein [Pasteurella atlantica]MDP8052214.1 hypothetical protein [Pasteurella atlantica]MDP8101261.1 hypothetical protein [Pasteurella atlantica]MDP8105672.1 hypothetical protein [Pasteurella atlantica]MDP8149060.1 hypothetical protein [Pasteurella atlantica]